MINNINRDAHFRFEDEIFQPRPYAFGFTMRELSVVTKNEAWELEFIDRTEELNRFRPLHKHLLLLDFAFYWESEERNVLSRLKDEAAIQAQLIAVSQTIPKRNYILKPCTRARDG